MWDENQKTLNATVKFSGIGLHSGKKIVLTNLGIFHLLSFE